MRRSLVKERLFLVGEEGVRRPDGFHHIDANRQRSFLHTLEGESRVAPKLSQIEINCVVLNDIYLI